MSLLSDESDDNTYTEQANQPGPAKNLRINIKINRNWETGRADEDIWRLFTSLGKRIFSRHVQSNLRKRVDGQLKSIVFTRTGVYRYERSGSTASGSTALGYCRTPYCD